MILYVFAIYDRQGDFYSNPFFIPHVGLARRTFGEMARDPDSQVGRYPADFSLYELGTFDNVSCKFTLGQPLFVCTAISTLTPPFNAASEQ